MDNFISIFSFKTHSARSPEYRHWHEHADTLFVFKTASIAVLCRKNGFQKRINGGGLLISTRCNYKYFTGTV